MSDIRGFKLITGEDVVADLVKVEHDSDRTMYVLENPIMVIVQPNMSGNVQLSFAPFPPFSKDSKKKVVTIDRDHVVYAYEVQQEILNGYNSLFGSGLVVPNLSLKSGGIPGDPRDEESLRSRVFSGR